ncbi:MAG: beta strand repeat-containing protein [Fimbriiglobus sp.]
MSIRNYTFLVLFGFLASAMPARAQFDWTNAAGGQFLTATNWNAAPPYNTLSDIYNINLAGTYTITLNGNASVGSLNINNAGTTFTHNNGANLTLGGTLTHTAGAYTLNGTITGGTITTNGAGLITLGSTGIVDLATVTNTGSGGFQLSGGRFRDSVLGNNVIVFRGTNDNVMLSGNTSFQPGVNINVNQTFGRVRFAQTVTHGASGNAFNLQFNGHSVNTERWIQVEAGHTVTFGPSSVINSYVTSSSGGYTSGAGLLSGGTGSTIINQGVIEKNGSGGFEISTENFTNAPTGTITAFNGFNGFGLGSTNFTNQGQITANGSYFRIGSSNFVNSGTLLSSNDGNFIVGAGGAFSNTGLIDVSTATTAARFLVVRSMTTAQLGNFKSNAAGTFQLGDHVVPFVVVPPRMILNNAGATFALNATTQSISMANSTIRDGTVTTTGGASIRSVSGENYTNFPAFEGVTFTGTLNIAETGGAHSFILRPGTGGTLTSFGGPSNIYIMNDRNSPSLSNGLLIEQTGTLDNFTYTMDVRGFRAYPGLELRDGNSLTLGSSAIVRSVRAGGSGGQAEIRYAGSGTSNLTNNGLIEATQSTGFVIDLIGTITNSGRIQTFGGSSMEIRTAGGLTNTSGAFLKTNDGGDTLSITNVTTFNNAGTIQRINGLININSTSFSNTGLIDAEAAGTAGRVNIRPNLTTAQLGNFRAGDGNIWFGNNSILTTINNTSATLNLVGGAGQTGSIVLDRGRILGGNVNTSAGALVRITNTSSDPPNTLDGVTFNGTIDAATNGFSKLTITGSSQFATTAASTINLRNNGELLINQATFGGGSQLLTVDSRGTGGNSVSIRSAPNLNLTILTNTLFHGQFMGMVGATGTESLTNNGTFRHESGFPISFNTGLESLVNSSSGVLETVGPSASGQFGITIESGVVLNNQGIIRGLTGGDVLIRSSTITSSGTMLADGTGSIVTLEPTTSTTNSGTMTASNSALLQVKGTTFTNSGIVSTNSSGYVHFVLNSPTLGSVFDNSAGTGLLDSSAGGSIEISAVGLVMTSGQLGAWKSRTDGGLRIGNVSVPVVLNNSTLTLNSTTGSIEMGGLRIVGGTVTTAPGYALYPRNAGGNELSGVNFSGTISFSQIASGLLTLTNGTNFTGPTNIVMSNLNTNLYVRQTMTMANTTISLENANAHVEVQNGNTLTIAVGSTVNVPLTGSSGTRKLTSNATGTNHIVNNGVIESSGLARMLLIDNNGTFTNNNIIRAITSGRVDINPGGGFVIGAGSQLLTTTSGQINILTPLVSNAGTVTVTSGTFNVTTAGTANFTNTTAGVFTAATGTTSNFGNTATSTIANAGAFTLAGTLNLGPAATPGLLTTTSLATINGTANARTTIQSGGIVGGAGRINGVTQVLTGGRLSPGNSPGQITIGGGLDVGGGLEIEIAGGTNPNNSTTVGNTSPGGGFDTVKVEPPPTNINSATNIIIRAALTTVRLGANDLNVTGSPFWRANAGQRWSIASTSNGSITLQNGVPGDPPSTPLTMPYPAVVDIYDLQNPNNPPINYTGFGIFNYEIITVGNSGAGQQRLDLVWTPVPEPTTMLGVSLLSLLGVAGLRKLYANRAKALAA